MTNQETVWLVEFVDYDASGVVVVGRTYDAAISALKERYGPPYIVSWREREDERLGRQLIGDFKAVPGYSTEHRAVYDVYEIDVSGENSPAADSMAASPDTSATQGEVDLEASEVVHATVYKPATQGEDSE